MFVEISRIELTLRHLGSHSRPPRAVYKLAAAALLGCGCDVKPKIIVCRAYRRRIVILKSPFHYKTPKHHLGYDVIYFKVVLQLPTAIVTKTADALAHGLVRTTPHKLRV